jgi:WS/DGAT/MGAT family acyltransferase
MRRLSGLDSAFLALETAHSTGHVGGLSILDPSTAARSLDLARLQELYAERLPLVPVLRQRLVGLPLGIDQPCWADDPAFDLSYHLREIALPAPGDDRLLAEQVARLHERPLDRSRPLWETYLITGLRDARVGLYIKVHHAAFDGVSGTDLLTVLMDLSPEGRDLPPAPPWQPEALPGQVRLGLRAARGVVHRPVDAVRIVADTARALPRLGPALAPWLGRSLQATSPDGELIDTTAGRAPATPLNRTITPHRRFSTASLSLDDVKTVKNAFGVTVNDVVMALSAGVLRTWLDDRGALPAHPLVAMVPVSIRDESATNSAGNKVSAMLAQVPTHLADPIARLHLCHEATLHAKGQQAFIPQGLIDEITDFAPPALTSRIARMIFGSHLLNRLPAFNVVISNIPGPPVPVYLAGARLLAHYPLSVVTDGLALNITVISYLGQMHFGLVADRAAVPDVDAMAEQLHAELAVLLEAAARA